MTQVTAASPTFHIPRVAAPVVRTETLPNGVRIVMNERPGAKTMDVRIASTVGSWNEPQGKEGLAHLVEHMTFEGTPTRTYAQIKAEQQAMGNQFNAYTEDSDMVIYGTVPNRDAGKAADLLVDMYAHPHSGARRLTKEARAINNEIRMKIGDKAGMADLALDNMLEGKQPQANDGWGNPNTVKPADVREWNAKNMTGANTVVYLDGEPSKFPLGVLRKQLAQIPAGTRQEAPAFQGYAPGAQVQITPFSEDRSANIVMALPTKEDADINPAAVKLVSSMLNDRLNTALREHGWMTYGVQADGAGDVLKVSTELHPRDVREGVELMSRTVRRLPESITADQLAAAKTEVLARTQSRVQTPEWSREAVFGAALAGAPAPKPNAALRAIANVSLADVRAAARAVADFSKVKIAAYGNVEGSLTDIRGGLRDGGIDVKLAHVPVDTAAWQKRTDLPADPRDH